MATKANIEKTINVTNTLNTLYKSECKGFSAQARFIAELAKATPEKLKEMPAIPAKGDKSAEAETLRSDAKKVKQENKAIEEYNASIDRAKLIVDQFSIDASRLKNKGTKQLLMDVVAAYPYRTKDNVCVTIGNLPSYLKKEYAKEDIHTVATASWITALSIAAEAKRDGKTPDTTYKLTIAPVLEEGEVIEFAEGDIVNSKMQDVSNKYDILAKWDKLAPINQAANKVGREAKDKEYQERKQAM